MKGGENMENCKIKSHVIVAITCLICGMLLASVMIIAASNLITAQNSIQGGGQSFSYQKNEMTHRDNPTPAPTSEGE